ncbi:MAG TPA: hypothetical protein GX694_10960 [Actinomycetales bacterium]|nr:hypothetical protein [Actinomycetales bacterium]
MDLTGSIARVLLPALETAYGSYTQAGGVGSSVLDGILVLPALVVELTLDLLAGLGGDIGSTFY